MELTGHVTDDLLIAFFCGELGPDRSAKLLGHTADCEVCARDFEVFKSLFSGMIGMLTAGGKKYSAGQLRLALRENLKKHLVFYRIIEIENFVPLLLAKTAQGLASIIFARGTKFEAVEAMKKNFPQLWAVESFEETEPECRQIEEYFRGGRQTFHIALDESLLGSDFQKKVLFALPEIPYGHFTTYGDLARRINNKKAARAVGMALSKNPLPIVLPCHRIVAGRGRLGGFTGGLDLKLKLLAIEGVNFPHASRQTDLFEKS